MQQGGPPHSREASKPASPVIDPGTYSHSPPHYAVARRDHAALRKIILGLPKPASNFLTESDAIAEEAKAEALSAVIDSRDVPGHETPLHLAVRLADASAAEILMSAGADCSLQNANGWSSLQEAVCTRQDAIARIIVKHYQPLGWAKWCRRLPLVVAAMKRMRDFYMQVSFNFESSVIPLIARAAPSDTYRIWKRGSSLRTDMTISGFDGFKIQRTAQTFLFLGEGGKDDRLAAGSLVILDHKNKVIMNALDGADKDLSDREVAQEVSSMAQTNVYRPGVDVTQAILLPQLSWMWQEKVEIVNGWKAKPYEMHNVLLSVKSRQVPGAMSDKDFFQSLPILDGGDLIAGKEKQQHAAKASASSKIVHQDVDKHRAKRHETIANEVALPVSTTASRASTISIDDGKGHQEPTATKPKKSFSDDDIEETQDKNRPSRLRRGRKSIDTQRPPAWELEEASMHVNERKNQNEGRAKPSSEGSKEREFKKGLRPILWLTPDFPLKVEELLPLLDILANKVKAIRRLRELLTTKLPQGTFPVKIAFPVIPTIRVVITFSRFEEVRSNEDFRTLSSSFYHDADPYQSSSWLSWIKGPMIKTTEESSMQGPYLSDEDDPFVIPKDYKWNKPVVQKGKKVVAASKR